jgi:VWFA-related protein
LRLESASPSPALYTFLLLSILIPLSTAFPYRASAAPQDSPIRVEVNRVEVGVTVTDASGRFVRGLGRSNFQIFDNGAEQPLTDFATDFEPAHVLVLIESGPAVYLLESGHLAAAHRFLDGLSRDDQVAVARYSASAELLQNFTVDKRAAAYALENLQFNLGFGSLNLSASVAQALAWLRAIPGKKSIVLLSTGVDTTPPDSAKALLDHLPTSGVRILAVSLSGGLRAPIRQGRRTKAADSEKLSLTEQQFEAADGVLRRLAQASGGRGYFPGNAAQFSAACAEIAEIIRHEYSLAFAPPVRDGRVHSIEVRLISSDPGTSASLSVDKLDYRRAYVAPVPPGP